MLHKLNLGQGEEFELIIQDYRVTQDCDKRLIS